MRRFYLKIAWYSPEVFRMVVLILSSYVFNANAQPALNTRINAIDGAEMVFVPAGGFIMGSDPEDIDRMWKKFNWDNSEKPFTKNEQPAHRVQVDGFWMYRTLVTVAQYRRYCEATGRSMPDPPSYGWKDTNPMVNVTWYDASAYCAWAGGRLPYEAEWEYAARGSNTGIDRPRTAFVWGDMMPANLVGNLADETFLKGRFYNNPNFHIFNGYTDGYVTASPVTAFPANELGLYDMAGNVLEWCGDRYSADYYINSPVSNPHGPDTGTNRVLRGGAFDTIPTITRIARRLGNYPDIRNDEKGFRCVLER